MTRRSAVSMIVLGFVVTVGLLQFTIQDTKATPNWARKYKADCAMCHLPSGPQRLNSYGQQFRRAGYRTPDEFNQDQDVTRVGDLLGTRLRSRFGYESHRGEVSRTEFTLQDFSIFYSGAVTRNLSAWTHTNIGSDGVVVFDGFAQGVFGNSDRFASVKIGELHGFSQTGFGTLDRPTGINAPSVFTTRLTNGGAPFIIDTIQKGLEASYVYGPGRLYAQVLNGVNSTGSGTASKVDIDAGKDFLVAYEHILDDLWSGLTLFFYDGNTHGTVTPLGRRFDFSRLGITANKVVPIGGAGFLELQAGYIRSHDNVPAQVGTDKDGNAFYVEADQYLMGPELAFLERFVLIDQDVPRPHSTRKDYTAGVVTRWQTWMRVALEYTYTDNRDNQVNGSSGHSALLECLFGW